MGLFFYAQNLGEQHAHFKKNTAEINAIEGFELRKLLTLRRKQLNCHLYILENDDSVDDLERAIGFPVMTNIFDGMKYASCCAIRSLTKMALI